MVWSILVRPAPVSILENGRIEDQAADEDEKKDDRSTQSVEKYGEPVKRTQAADEGRRGEPVPCPEYVAEVATSFEEDSVDVVVGGFCRALVGSVSTMPINLSYTKTLQCLVNIL